MTEPKSDEIDELAVAPLPADHRPVVSVIGYYGNVPAMNSANYSEMMKIVEEVLRDDWKLDPKEVVWAATGGTWCSHLPCSLWAKHSDADPKKALLILPCQFEQLQEAFSYKSRTESWLRAVSDSHSAMTRRLRETKRDARETRVELLDMAKAGCEVIGNSDRSGQTDAILERVNYLIYMPGSKDDSDRRHGSQLFSQAYCTKRVVPLNKFLDF